MKTLEDILQGVTPPETWSICKYPGHHYAIMPDKDAFIAIAQSLKKRDAAMILRAARNFAPLVRALEGLRDACKYVLLPTINDSIKQGYKMSTWTPEQMQWAKAVEDTEKALTQALADEP